MSSEAKMKASTKVMMGVMILLITLTVCVGAISFLIGLSNDNDESMNTPVQKPAVENPFGN